MTFSTWSYTTDLTAWPVTYDAYGQPVYGNPVSFKGTFGQSSDTKLDDAKEEFVPNSTYWTRYPVITGWVIAVGTFTGNPPAEAEKIRKIERFDSSMHGDTGVDMAVYT